MMSSTEIALPKKKRVAKSRIVGVRVTEAEFLRLSRDADFAGRTLSDWAHDRLVSSEVLAAHFIEHHSFTELVGIQMLLMACFSPLLQGHPITAEEYQELVRRAQSGKAKRARELLAQRMGQEEK